MADPTTDLGAFLFNADKRIPDLALARASAAQSELFTVVYDTVTNQTVKRPVGAASAVTSNGTLGGTKFVRYASSQFFEVPANATTLDRLDPTFLVVNNAAVVLNPSSSPLQNAEPSKRYRLAIVAAGTAGALVAFADADAATTATFPVQWFAEGTAEAEAASLDFFNANGALVAGSTTVRSNQYGPGATVKLVVGGALQIFATKRFLDATTFANNEIPAPTGNASDTNWTAAAGSSGYVPFTAVNADEYGVTHPQFNTQRELDKWVIEQIIGIKSATPASPPANPPAQVTGLVATPGSASVALVWNAPNNGGAVISAYTVRYRRVGDATYLFASTTANTYASVNNLTNGTPYEFVVFASNKAGNGQASTPATATPALVVAEPTPTFFYDTTLDEYAPEGGSVAFGTTSGHAIRFLAIGSASGAPADTVLVFAGQSSFATIPGEYLGKRLEFRDAAGNWKGRTATGADAVFIDGTLNF